MSPSPNQFPQSSKGSDQAQASEPIVRRPNPPKPPLTPSAPTPVKPVARDAVLPPPPTSVATPPAPTDTVPKVSDSSTVGDTTSPNQEIDRRQQPIPPPSEPMQYRAIGLVRGKYAPSEEQFTRGMLVTPDENSIDAVLLGRVMSLVKNHLDLTTDHLWVVYPRSRQEDDNLHFQIVGVWEPEKLDKTASSSQEGATESTEAANSDPSESQPLPVEDGYFSVRGEVVYQSQDQQKLVVKIKQAPRKEGENPKFFKLTLKGVLEKKAIGFFWEFHSQREAQSLLIQEAKEIAALRPRKKPFSKGKGGGGRKPWKQQRPTRPGAAAPSGVERPALPRPTKRQQPSV